MKDVGLRIRVERVLRDKFLEVCRAQDKPAAQVLREFMRGYVLEHPIAPEQRDRSDATEAYQKSKLGGE